MSSKGAFLGFSAEDFPNTIEARGVDRTSGHRSVFFKVGSFVERVVTMNHHIALSPNPLVRFLKKPADQFTKADIIKYVEAKGIQMVNFRYVAGDGRLKTLNFVINSKSHLDQMLSRGERVDGSNLFSFIDAASSDLYVVPRFKTAFINPFVEVPTLDLLCSFYSCEGEPLQSAPHHIIRRAHQVLKERTGLTFEALGELEYYLFSEMDSIYPIAEQRGYHESHPFSKWGYIRREAMRVISSMGGNVKYGHAEVGNVVNGDVQMVQHEIEFLPMSVEDAADQIVLAKWAVREIAYRNGLEVSFAPKIMVGHAGSGLHIHARLVKDGANVMVDGAGLSDTARKTIAGFLSLAPALCAFGNTVPTSYLRLVPHQEAPTSVCWGDRNRSVLVRVPLGWLGVDAMIFDANPQEPVVEPNPAAGPNPQTIEFRSPDGSANAHLLLAGLTVAARHGLEDPDALDMAQRLYVKTGAETRDDLDHLPSSCSQAADCLLAARETFEAHDVFPPGLLDRIAKDLKGYEDMGLSEKIFGKGDSLRDLVNKFIHCG